MRTLWLVTIGAAFAAGCGLDCSGQSIPHCPSSSGAECVNGAWQCTAHDLSGEAPPDFSSPRDLVSASD